jgi:hypothetical protein
MTFSNVPDTDTRSPRGELLRLRGVAELVPGPSMLSQEQFMEGDLSMISTRDSFDRSVWDAFKPLSDDTSLASGTPPGQVRQRVRVSIVINPP